MRQATNISTKTPKAKGKIRSCRGRQAQRRRRSWRWLGQRSWDPCRTTNGGQTMRTMRQTGTKAIQMAEPFNLMEHVTELTHPAQGSLGSQGGRLTMDHSKEMARIGGTEVGSVVARRRACNGSIDVDHYKTKNNAASAQLQPEVGPKRCQGSRESDAQGSTEQWERQPTPHSPMCWQTTTRTS